MRPLCVETLDLLRRFRLDLFHTLLGRRCRGLRTYCNRTATRLVRAGTQWTKRLSQIIENRLKEDNVRTYQVGFGRLVADNTVEASDHDLLHAMRGSQAPANRCNPLIITRSWSRGRRFEFARRLSKKCLFAGKTLEIKEASAHRPGLTYCNSPKKHSGSNGGGMAKSIRWSRAGRETGPIGGVAYWNRVTYFFRHRTGLSGEWEDVKETVELDWAPCTFGGERP